MNRLLIVLGLTLIVVLRATLLGRAVRAMMQSPTGALLVGIDVRRLHPAVFGVGLALAGAAGALLSMVFEISPSMGEPYTVTALIVIALGGFGSVTGSLLGGQSKQRRGRGKSKESHREMCIDAQLRKEWVRHLCRRQALQA